MHESQHHCLAAERDIARAIARIEAMSEHARHGWHADRVLYELRDALRLTRELREDL